MNGSLKAVLFQLRQGDKLQRIRMGGFHHDRRRVAFLECFTPAKRAKAPAIARLEAGKTVLRHRRGEVIAASARERQEFARHPDADQVRPQVGLVGVAATVTKIPGQRVEGAGRQIGAKDVFFNHCVAFGEVLTAGLSI